MHHAAAWLLTQIHAPRWYPITLLVGTALFTYATGYIHGHATGRR